MIFPPSLACFFFPPSFLSIKTCVPVGEDARDAPAVREKRAIERDVRIIGSPGTITRDQRETV